MLPLGTPAPEFSLPNVDGTTVSLADLKQVSGSDAKGLLVVFMCNHCPFVIHLADALADFAKEYMPQGLAMVGISANDVAGYPDDSPEKMAVEAKNRGYIFPYLYDESQEVAKSYRAACTPDFYLFDANHELVYRGQFDETRPDSGKSPTGADLRAAVDALLADKELPEDQTPSLGCNIKWRAGNEPDYFG